MRRLDAYWWSGGTKRRIGTLAQSRGPLIVFEWDQEFLSSPVELSPLTFKKSAGLIEMNIEPFVGLAGLFADQVPDGFGRVLLQRALTKTGIDFDDVSPLDYLQLIGESGMGALSFEPSMPRGAKWAEGKINLDELQGAVRPILAGTPSDVLEAFLSGGASPNGARPKILAKESDGKLIIGDEKLKANEWLIKFRSPEDSKDIGKLEFIYSILARHAGVNVPETRLFKSRKDYFFASKRFDRTSTGERVHMHTLSGILGVSPMNFSVGYDHYAKVAMALTKDSRSVEQVFRLACFNVLASNQDDHTKNVAFLMTAEGDWQVAPAYDLTIHRTQSGQHKMPVMGEGAPTQDTLKAFAKELGLSKALAKSVLEETADSLSRFPKLAKEYDLRRAAQTKVEGTLKRIGSVAAGKKELSPRRSV